MFLEQGLHLSYFPFLSREREGGKEDRRKERRRELDGG